MAYLYTLILFISLIGLAIGLFNPLIYKGILKSRSTRGFIASRLGLLVLVCFVIIGVTAPKSIQTNNTSSKSSTSSTSIKPSISTKTVTSTSPIAFTTSTVQDSSLASGTTSIKTKGVNGLKTNTYSDTYTNGKETSSKLVSSVVTTAAVNEVVDQGTYVAPTPTPAPAATAPTCTNGSYVNSDGNTVCSPEASSTVPAGATAQCVDGTYSFSQHRSGTCSYHGGVSQWLN